MIRILFFIFSLHCISSYGQATIQNSVLSTVGNSYTSANVVVDFTFGETFTNSLSASHLITQGFQQPLRKKIVVQPTGGLNTAGIYDEEMLEIQVYPNPFQTCFSIELNANLPLILSIYDNSGRMVFTQKIGDLLQKIELNDLATGSYSLVLKLNEDLIFRQNLIKTHH
jgi:hypothetical protein